MGELDVYKRNDGKWAWRLVAPNGQIIATDGGQGYENRRDCEAVAKAVVRGDHAPDRYQRIDGPVALGTRTIATGESTTALGHNATAS
jgi:uncharacterized protein YegP (UPF0339 family)